MGLCWPVPDKFEVGDVLGCFGVFSRLIPWLWDGLTCFPLCSFELPVIGFWESITGFFFGCGASGGACNFYGHDLFVAQGTLRLLAGIWRTVN